MIAPLSIDPQLRYGFQRYNPVEGAGLGFGGPNTNLLVQMLGQTFIGGKGLLPLGITHQNLYDRMQSLRLQKLHDEVIADSTKHDAATLTNNFMGLARLSGTPVGPGQYKDIQDLSKQGAAFIPTAIQFPGMASAIDAMMGFRGSATVMSEYMFRGGRFRMDPLSGQMGMGGESMKRLTSDVFRGMFSGNAYHDQVLSAGRTGMLFEELQQLGMVRGGRVTPEALLTGGNVNDRRALTRAVQRVTGRQIDPADIREELGRLTPAETQRLAQDQGVQSAVRAFDSRRVQRTLKDYSGVVKAMQEIFGHAGKPNAPVPELMNALNQLTGGALTQMDPGQAETTVREMYNLAKGAGLGLEGMMVMSQVAAQQSQAMGLEPTATPGVLSSMLQFRGAFQQLGMGGAPTYGLGNIQQLTVDRGFLRAAGEQSRSAMQMGTALRIADTYEGAFRADSAAMRYVQALKAGQAEFRDDAGRIRSVGDLTQQQFLSMMSGGAREGTGIDRATLIRFFQQSGANKEFIQRYGLGDIAQRAQGPEFFRLLSQRATTNAQQRMAAMGIRGEPGLARETTRAAVEAMSNLTPEQRADRDTRQNIIGEAVQQRLRQAAAGQVAGVDAAAARRMLAEFQNNGEAADLFAEEIWGAGEVFARSGEAGFGKSTLQNRLAQFDKRMLRAMGQTRARAQVRALQQRALAPLGRAGLLRNAIEAVQDADPDDDLGDIIARTFGGRAPEEFRDALTQGKGGGALGELRRRAAALRDIGKKFATADPKQRLAMHKQLGEASDEYSDAIAKIMAIAGKHKQLPGQMAARKKKVQLGLGALSEMPGFAGQAGKMMSAALSGDGLAKRDTVTAEDDGQDEQDVTITINVGRIEQTKDGMVIKGKGRIPIPAGRQ